MTINVLHIRDTGGMLGAENVILELSRKSQSMGIKPIIGTFSSADGSETELAKHAAKYGISGVNIPCRSKIDINAVKFLRNFIHQNNIHLVHCHGYKEDLYAWLSKSTPLIATNHLWKRTTTALKFYAYLDSKILKRFDSVVAVSAPIEQEMIDAGIKAGKIQLIPNGIDIEKFAQHASTELAEKLKQQLNIPADHTVIGMISSITQEKGHAEALPAIAEIIKQRPSTHLLIVGSGPEQTHLQQLARDLTIDQQVTFTGARSDIPALLSALDIFLLYSSMEGLPMALLEAMASGKAIIATNVGDVSRAVIDNKTGILLARQEQTPLYHALECLLNDSNKRTQLGQAAKERVQKHFSSEAMALRYCELYRELAA